MNKITKKLMTVMMIGAMLSASILSVAAEGVVINHLSVNNTLVRITGEERYLLLPVEEANDDARINVLVDGKVAEVIYVRLAQSKTDYTVPFDLKPYAGKNVILDVVTSQGRQSVREAKDDACWKEMKLVEAFDTANREVKYRPAFHHTPLYGWMNDPNGMFFKEGMWHLYYQYNPYGSKWQNMTWGHSTSADLINWKHLPNAIKPDGLGAIFSGSCSIDKENTAGRGNDAVIALYTSAGTSQMQSLAVSTDNGTTFDVYPGNPVLTLESEARDPKIFWNETTREWNMVLAHALDREMLFFTSRDLKTWTPQSAFGRGLGAQEGVWECPDIFELPVEGSDERKWVLLCNINPGGPFGGSATQYFIGHFDGKTFTADTDAEGSVPTKWLDYGKDHYATVSWSDAPQGRRTVIGWMSNWQYAAEVPTTQYRSANTLPREMGLFRAADGRIYARCTPSPELDGLRGKLMQKATGMVIGEKKRSFALPAANDGICEVQVDFDAKKASTVVMELANKSGDKVLMTYDAGARTLSFDRRLSGIVDFSESFPAVTVAPSREAEGNISLRIFVDRSSIEVFGNDGRFVMTNLVFPNTPYSVISISAEGGNAKLSNLKVYSLITR